MRVVPLGRYVAGERVRGVVVVVCVCVEGRMEE